MRGDVSMAKILFVVTGASYWTLKDGTRHPTGYWAEEFAAPYSELTGAGHEVVVATPGGVVPYVDVMSLRPSMAGSEQIAREQEEILRSAEELRRPIELADARLEDYDAVCHAPAAILATRRNGVSPFAGYRVTAFTNDEEEAVGLRAKAKWLVEDELVNVGVTFTRGEIWKPYTVVDRNLYTGQNPASSGPLAREVLKELI